MVFIPSLLTADTSLIPGNFNPWCQLLSIWLLKNMIQLLVWSHHLIELLFVIFVSFWPIVRIGSIIRKGRCFSPVPRFNHDTRAGTIWVWISAAVGLDCWKVFPHLFKLQECLDVFIFSKRNGVLSPCPIISQILKLRNRNTVNQSFIPPCGLILPLFQNLWPKPVQYYYVGKPDHSLLVTIRQGTGFLPTKMTTKQPANRKPVVKSCERVLRNLPVKLISENCV